MDQRTDERRTETERETEPTSRARNPDKSGRGVSALLALLGAWMVVQAFLFDVVLGQFWNDVIIGAILVAVGGYNYYRRSNAEIGSVAAAVVAALLGAWLVASPFMFGADTGTTEAANAFAFWNDVIVGLVVLGLGAYSAYKARSERRVAPERRTEA